MMSSMVMQSDYYFSLKCKTEIISNKEGVPRAELLGLEKAIDPNHLQRKNQSEEKKSTAKTRTAK